MKQSLLEKLQKEYHAGQYQKVIDTLLETSPEEWGYDLTCLFARALNEVGEYEDAEAYLLKVAKEGKTDAMWYMRLGYSYFLQKKYKDAVFAFEKAISMRPYDKEIWLFLILARSCENSTALAEQIHAVAEQLRQLKEDGAEQEAIFSEAEKIGELVAKLSQEKGLGDIHIFSLSKAENGGGTKCFATNRVMEEKKKIGFMYRDLPKEEQDSGWRFTAGDETEDYMTGKSQFQQYDLQEICEYDPAVIPFLEAPYGKAYYRDETGMFREIGAE